jgi:hypothetical protein
MISENRFSAFSNRDHAPTKRVDFITHAACPAAIRQLGDNG